MGSWGPQAVEKVLRAQEHALRVRVPVVHLVDAVAAPAGGSGAVLAGRRGAGRILYNQVRLSGLVPQVCALLGPSDGVGERLAALCDVVVERDDAAVAGAGHVVAPTDEEAIDWVRRYLGFFPSHWEWAAPFARPSGPSAEARAISEVVASAADEPADARALIDGLLDAGTFLEISAGRAPGLAVGHGRLNGRPLGIVADQREPEGAGPSPGAAETAARLIQTCNAFNLPLLFLGGATGAGRAEAGAERQAVIRSAVRMIAALSEATVPRISVIVGRANGAGALAMPGPAFDLDACLALVGASAGVPGPLDASRLASELVVDAVVEPDRLREELVRRFSHAASRRREWPARRTSITPG